MEPLQIRPNPLIQGQAGEVHGPAGTTVDFDWDPAGTPTSGVIGEDGKLAFTTPSNAKSVVCTDPTGQVGAVSATCGPP